MTAARRVWTFVGVFFLVLGSLTLLGILTQARLGVVPWEYVAYASLNFLLAYGCLSRQLWAYYALLVNAAGMAGLTLMRAALPPPSGRLSAHLVAACAILALAWAGHRARRVLKNSGHYPWAGALFFGLWALMLCYTVSKEFI